MARISKQPKPFDAVLCADTHIREKQPTCRTDCIIEAQEIKWAFIRQLCGDAPLLIAGDIFDKWKPSPWLIGKAAEWLPKNVICIAGQHDLPAHNAQRWDEGGLGTLHKAGRVTLLPDTGDNGFYSGGTYINNYYVSLLHKMIYQGKEPFPGAEKIGSTAKALLNRHSDDDFQLILTGDNHQPFTEELDGRLVVNPGSVLRTTAAQIDSTPRVYTWNADSNTVEPIYLPIDHGIISREHINKEAKRDERIDAFVDQLNVDVELSLSFENNAEKVIAESNIKGPVAKIFRKALS